MYNTDKIVKAITEQVGFEKSYLHKIADSLQVSKTHATYNQAHPLVTYTNILNCVEQVSDAAYPPYLDTQTYKQYDVAYHDTKLYQAKEDIVVPEVFNAARWEETNHFSVELGKIERAAAGEVVTAMMINKQINGKAKALWETVKLYEGVGSLVNTIAKESRFVGFEIDMANMRDMAIRFHSVGLQLSQPNPTLDLYVYHTSKRDAIAKVTLSNVGAGAFSWHDVNLLLPFAGDYAAGGSFIIGYHENDLVGAAISKTDYDFSRSPCVKCSDYNVRSYAKWSRHLSISPFSVPSTQIINHQLWDTAQNRYNYKTNFGINLSLSIECDITDTVVNNAHLFAEAQKLLVVEKVLSMFMNNTNNSADAEKMRQNAYLELINKENHTTGLITRKEKALKALDFNMSGISRFCLPDDNTSIRKGAM